MKKFLKILKSIIFISIIIWGSLELNNIFIRKSLSKPWDMGNKIGGFYNEKEDYNVMFFGTSHSYCSFEPLVIYEKTGIKSYVLASQSQPLKITANYIKDALKRKNPRVIFVDINAAIYKIDEDTSVVNSYCDYMPLSLNKIKMIAKKVPYKNKPSAILPLVTYHSRWDELKDEDFNFNKSSYSDYLKGYVLLKNKSQSFSKGDGDIDDFREGARNFNEKKYLEENLEAFDEIMEVANKNGARVIFVKTPIYDYDLYSKNIKYFEKYLKEKNAEFVDFNKFTKEINLSKSDFYDPHHLNVVGAEKFNLFFIDFMEKNKIFEENLASDKSWQENFKKYNINKF
ncbi:MAG: hypothetical protein E7G36_05465 [Peptoniphilus rhinitidis]|uniref:hypothetical protein n=1 Tax=Peptoniphilus TaxID=162289 RepID=UPI0008DB12A7|nr:MULTISPECIES: hypothetical protein [Peptoniphilus]MDU3751153.1 hypothetical protein [Peptoniphilus rhinitidis]